MPKIHIYGHLKKNFDPNASLAESMVIDLSHRENESFSELITRIGLNPDKVGDCFINGRIVQKTTIITKDSRIGLFPTGMRLIDGGLYIKYYK